MIGGGNTAVEEALYLANIASEVYWCTAGMPCAQKKCCRTACLPAKRKARLPSCGIITLDEVLGDDSGVTGMRVKSVKDDATSEWTCAGVFIAIGHKPNTDIFAGQLDMKDGYMTIHSGTEGNATATSVPGCICRR